MLRPGISLVAWGRGIIALSSTFIFSVSGAITDWIAGPIAALITVVIDSRSSLAFGVCTGLGMAFAFVSGLTGLCKVSGVVVCLHGVTEEEGVAFAGGVATFVAGVDGPAEVSKPEAECFLPVMAMVVVVF